MPSGFDTLIATGLRPKPTSSARKTRAKAPRPSSRMIRKPARRSPGCGRRAGLRLVEESARTLARDRVPPEALGPDDAAAGQGGCVLPQSGCDASSANPSSNSRLGPIALSGDVNGRGASGSGRSRAAHEKCREPLPVLSVAGRFEFGGREFCFCSASCCSGSTSSPLVDGFQSSRISRVRFVVERGSPEDGVIERLNSSGLRTVWGLSRGIPPGSSAAETRSSGGRHDGWMTYRRSLRRGRRVVQRARAAGRGIADWRGRAGPK